jgi:hypothetical protein
MTAENRVVNAFRKQYRRNQADLDAFDTASSTRAFTGPQEAVAWCRQWWEDRIQGQALDVGERQLRGSQNRN